MPEHVELQQLVDEENENKPKIIAPKNRCRCPYFRILLATLSSLFFPLCSVIVKWMTSVDPTALVAYRYLGVLLPAIPIVIYGQEPIFPKGKRIMLLLRSFMGTAALMLSFHAFRHMPLADASVFSVQVFTSIFGRLFLKKTRGIFNVFSVILTLIAVFFIARSSAISGATVNALGESVWSMEYGELSLLFLQHFLGQIHVLLRALKSIHFSAKTTNFGSFALVQHFLVSYFIGALSYPPYGLKGIL